MNTRKDPAAQRRRTSRPQTVPRKELRHLGPPDAIEDRIWLIRGERVMLDADLAELYGVETKRLNQAVRRNLARFPGDFMFQLTRDEVEILRSQIVTSSSAPWGGRRYLPYAFTEQGVAMLSSVLASDRAAAVNILIMRAFVQLRRARDQYVELRERTQELAQRADGHDTLLAEILEVLDALARRPTNVPRPIGFRTR